MLTLPCLISAFLGLRFGLVSCCDWDECPVKRLSVPTMRDVPSGDTGLFLPSHRWQEEWLLSLVRTRGQPNVRTLRTFQIYMLYLFFWEKALSKYVIPVIAGHRVLVRWTFDITQHSWHWVHMSALSVISVSEMLAQLDALGKSQRCYV